MAYRNTTTNRQRTPISRAGVKSANVSLEVKSPDGDYMCQTPKSYTEKSSIIQEVNDSDGFLTLASFSKNAAALTLHNAKVIVVKNISNIAAEIALTTIDFRNDSGGTTTDVQNSVDMNEEDSTGEETVRRTWSMILPAGDFMYLPTSRIIEYSPLNTSLSNTLESAGNAPAGYIAIEPKDINSGNEYVDMHLFAGSTYNSGADIQIAEDVAIAETDITVDDGDWFEVGDLIMINSEVMQVEAISGAVLTVKRGLLGSTEAAHSDDDDLRFFFGNEHLPFDNGKCMTSQTGQFSQKGAFFGYARSADRVVKGVVVGSVCIGPFYTRGGYLDWGLQNIKPSDNTGLAVSTQYSITFVIDEYNAGGIDSTSTEQIVTFTTDASDTTFAGSGNAVLPKIQAAIDAFFYDESSGLKNKKVHIGLHNGDVRVKSMSNHSETRVGISKSTSGTTPFDLGRFPTMSSNVPDLQGTPHGGGTTDTIVYGPASSLELETIDDIATGKTILNKGAFLLDDGNGNLRHNDSVVGSIDYTKGHIQFNHLPNAEFKVYAESLSAHSGGCNFNNNAQNTLVNVSGRSLNPKENSKLELILLG